MDWVTFVIPLIAVAVWILSHLANQQQELRRPPRVPPPRRPPPINEATSSPVAGSKPEEENKYREEMDRKRVKPPPRTIPRPRPRRQEPLPRPTLVLTPLPPPLPPLLSKSEEFIPSIAVPTAPLVVEPMAQVGPPPIVAGKPNAALRNLRDLLRKPENLAGALVLKEIFDLPIAKRPRRRM
jgi:hypothetical protein